MTGFIFGLLIGGAGGLIVGWVMFPEPAAFRNWWAKHGWARRT